jgi:hypothetical protein
MLSKLLKVVKKGYFDSGKLIIEVENFGGTGTEVLV